MNTILLYFFITLETVAVTYFGVVLARFAFAKRQVNKQYIYVNANSDVSKRQHNHN